MDVDEPVYECARCPRCKRRDYRLLYRRDGTRTGWRECNRCRFRWQ